jgi:hypothetical protein
LAENKITVCDLPVDFVLGYFENIGKGGTWSNIAIRASNCRHAF